MIGGARASAGRPADPNALRRDRSSDSVTWRHLPAAGRQGDAPAWPLTRATPRELVLWRREWCRPQAIVWEENGQVEEVALYVRAFAAAERPKAVVAARTLVRQMMDSLGITTPGLRAHRWIIDADPPAPAAAANPEAADARRERWEVLRGRP